MLLALFLCILDTWLVFRLQLWTTVSIIDYEMSEICASYLSGSLNFYSCSLYGVILMAVYVLVFVRAFDLRFTYVLAGWEGTASDSRILKDALNRTNCLRVPRGKYYLLDAGFMLRKGLVTPFRSTRYHLKEFSSRNPPRTPQELFNHRHSSLRNVVERAFGILKKRFPIIASGAEANYGIKTQNKIIIACCILHNYLMVADPDEELLAEVDEEIGNQSAPQNVHARLGDDEDEQNTQLGENLRNSIANAMWTNYTS